jgi:hypothetical protein
MHWMYSMRRGVSGGNEKKSRKGVFVLVGSS